MTTHHYIALLRGVNVGRAKRIAMADLRKLIADLGFDDVQSLLNSGNVVFTGPARPAPEIASAIEEALVMKLGVGARVTVLDSAELDEIVAGNPLLELAVEPSRLVVFILTRPRDRALIEPLAERHWGREALALGQRAVYVWCPDGMLECRAAQAVGAALGDATTSRNWNTVAKLQALCAQPQAAAESLS
jgi:uncharacterized protein (DUF1697 family)